MFTGIVEELGRLESRRDGRLRTTATRVVDGVEIGESIAVNGCCLTVVEFGEGWWEADVSDETLSRTSLATLGDDDGVNLERVVRASDRLGGHIVQGHVDGVGEIVDPVPTSVSVYPTDCCAIWSRRARSPSMVSASRSSSPLADGLTVAIIPHTAYVTTLGTKRPGDLVNVEVDVMARYVERLVLAYLPPETGAP